MKTNETHEAYDALIIDDESDICFLLSHFLKRKKISSLFVNSLKEAMDILLSQKPDIIFLDNHLPDGKGIELIDYIKEKQPKAKIIVISAYDSFKDREEASHRGADIFIGKPFSHEMIAEALDKLLN
jgi:DNA-binding NtrC family response regulator